MIDSSSDNRSRILDSALHLFSERGYDAVGVQEIADSCSVTKPTLYHYFGSKRGLIEALLKDRFEPFLGGMRGACAYKGDIVHNLNQCALYIFSRAQSSPDFFRLMLQCSHAPLASELGSALRPWNEEYFRLFEGLFAEAARDNGNMSGRQTAYALSFIGTLHAWASIVITRCMETPEELVYRIVHYFMHGIYS